ncbi:hypothetical protein [Spirulina sp. 06S082]|uniref:hypothetical protein n=1 Tax=Spirulina sp. 06S082 TaxID=3110248 RepID=UPI002B210E6E|nr:hypothetical protein [Spirulina sp. 06S082]MEA5472337.1 hypothetical protein [Spirulina sp. 06S082]
MNHISHNPNLDDFLPDSQIQSDLLYILWEQTSPEEIVDALPPGTLEIDDKYIEIPSNVKLEVIAKSYRQHNYESGFGDHYAALIAIGGVVSMTAGIPHPKYCYATLFYSSEKYLITSDFHSEMR